jgi:hypothetical protein
VFTYNELLIISALVETYIYLLYEVYGQSPPRQMIFGASGPQGTRHMSSFCKAMCKTPSLWHLSVNIPVLNAGSPNNGICYRGHNGICLQRNGTLNQHLPCNSSCVMPLGIEAIAVESGSYEQFVNKCSQRKK